MHIHKVAPLAPQGGRETPEKNFHSRRKWLLAAGGGALAVAAGYGVYANLQGNDEEVIAAGKWSPEAEAKYAAFFPAKQEGQFEYGRSQTAEAAAARHTNFYEFSSLKWCWKYVGPFQPEPWTVSITGLCRNPLKLELGEFYRRFQSELVERQYRLRCVEKWAMAVPWTGVPLAAVLKAADPLTQATHVRFVSFERPSEAPNQAAKGEYPWPYTEGLTLAEAMNELPLLAVGVYGRPLLKQHGARFRLLFVFTVARPFVCERHNIATVPRFHFPLIESDGRISRDHPSGGARSRTRFQRSRASVATKRVQVEQPY